MLQEWRVRRELQRLCEPILVLFADARTRRLQAGYRQVLIIVLTTKALERFHPIL